MVFYISLLHFAECIPFERSNQNFQDSNFSIEDERRKLNNAISFGGIHGDQTGFYSSGQPKKIRRYALFLPRRYDIRKNWNHPFQYRSYRRVLRPNRGSGLGSNSPVGNVIGKRNGAKVDLEYKGKMSPYLSANVSLQDKLRKQGVELDLRLEDLVKEVMDELILKERSTTSVSSTETSTKSTTGQLAAIRNTQKSRKLTAPHVSPAYDCDLWDEKSQMCWSWRAIGDTITFSIAIGHQTKIQPSFEVTWSKHYHVRKKSHPKIESLKVDNPPWNMVIGNSGLELRISPLTDTDFDANKFTAAVWKRNRHRQKNFKHLIHEIHFRIQIMPIDLGYVYIGEEITLNIERYAMLPAESMIFDWYLERGSLLDYLPSNMRVSKTGRSLFIKELREDQQGVVACSAYTKSGVFMSRRRFYIQILDNAMLTRPKNDQQNVSFVVDINKRAYRDTSLKTDINGKSGSEDSFNYDSGENDNSSETEEDTQDAYDWKQKGITADSESQFAMENEESLESEKGRSESSKGLMDPGRKDVLSSRDYDDKHSLDSNMLEQQNMGRVYQDDQMLKEPKVFGGTPTGEVDLQTYNRRIGYSSSKRLDNTVDESHENALEAFPKNSPTQEQSQHLPIQKHLVDTHVADGMLREETPVDSNMVLFPLYPNGEELEIDKEESLLAGSCTNDRECSAFAWCQKESTSRVSGYCKCYFGYRGNGIFCWENLYSIPGQEKLFAEESGASEDQVFSSGQKQKSTHPRKNNPNMSPRLDSNKHFPSEYKRSQEWPFEPSKRSKNPDNTQLGQQYDKLQNAYQYSLVEAESSKILESTEDSSVEISKETVMP